MDAESVVLSQKTGIQFGLFMTIITFVVGSIWWAASVNSSVVEYGKSIERIAVDVKSMSSSIQQIKDNTMGVYTTHEVLIQANLKSIQSITEQINDLRRLIERQ